jgi:hypothetical protein
MQKSSFALVLSGGETSWFAWKVGVLKALCDDGVDFISAARQGAALAATAGAWRSFQSNEPI